MPAALEKVQNHRLFLLLYNIYLEEENPFTCLAYDDYPRSCLPIVPVVGEETYFSLAACHMMITPGPVYL